MVRRTGPSCLPSSIAPNNTRTIVPKCHTNPLVSASDKCNGSSLLVMRNDSYRSMESFRISSVSDVTCYKHPIIESSELAPLLSGVRQPAPDEIGVRNGHPGAVWLH